MIDYEYGFVKIFEKVNVYVYKLDNLVWCEVDDEDYWVRVIVIVYLIIKVWEGIMYLVKRSIFLNFGLVIIIDIVKYV